MALKIGLKNFVTALDTRDDGECLIALDSETTGLDPIVDRINMLSFSCKRSAAPISTSGKIIG